MRLKNLIFSATAIGSVLAGALAVPALAQGTSGVFDRLSKGEWTVRFRDGSAPRKICVRSGFELAQLKLNSQNCTSVVVQETSDAVTVHHSCKARGFSRTKVRRETGALVQIESQGFIDDLPYQFAAEARRTGDCS